MTGKKFTIMFPTRERPDLLKDLLDSILKTTSNTEDIEVLIAYDNDDEVTKKFIAAYKCWSKWVNWVECARSLNFSRDYYNRMAKMATGEYFIICNDDAIFETQNWDVLAEQEILRRSGGRDSVFMGWIEDGLGQYRAQGFSDYCCFPMIGRDGYEALGVVFPERIPTWGADIWIASVFGIIGRIYKLPITIRHLTPHNGTRPVDHVQQRIRDNQVPFDMNPQPEEIRALKGAIRQKEAQCA